mmetsp:Transcript_19794/g.37771  ORF Transcript_19794/g.37771 Transcript_19794/m.37771 type:complete len:188 (+) Transcript_19794:298-861(+)|eukprot:CAMPEP_0114249382 /NCGR_PEP_ID=MMETSP0058-20121206/14111_1 /TAXON_ID=36894 /ORGANISM="Pyramimonas parkeae, CCMP726" /LENGTH=187 /DNA_ID=CAMNT_0001362921 /DNA_START=230 /DNA_END=793 /DNA_ORIENTATION=+
MSDKSVDGDGKTGGSGPAGNNKLSAVAWKVFAGALVGAIAWRHARQKIETRQRVITVVLQQGDTIGDLITKYVGDYTESNLELVHKLNKRTIPDIDLLSPGVSLKIPDNRKPELATAEAEWWRLRARSGMLIEYADPEDLDDDFEMFEEPKTTKYTTKPKPAKGWWGQAKEPEVDPNNSAKLLQDRW